MIESNQAAAEACAELAALLLLERFSQEAIECSTAQAHGNIPRAQDCLQRAEQTVGSMVGMSRLHDGPRIQSAIEFARMECKRMHDEIAAKLGAPCL